MYTHLPKIYKSCLYFRLNEGVVLKPISDIQDDDLITMLEKELTEYEFELAEYDNNHIYHETHNIIYKSIYEKITDIRNDRENIIDNYLQRYSEVIDKYSYELIFDS